MIRFDDVDPGPWSDIKSSILLMPLDTHIHRICLKMNFHKIKSANMKAVLKITRKFRKINPEDPVKYDFALSRFGIRNDFSFTDLFYPH
jgi:uncharacterized protein (TIGR02757 family)